MVHCSFCYPLIILKKSTKINFVTSLLLARNFLLASLFSFQGAASDLFQGQIEMLNSIKHFDPILSGGGYRTRTGDPLLAKQVLFQLS